MEFSEPFELIRMMKTPSALHRNPFYQSACAVQEEIDKMIDYAANIEDCLHFSPPQSIIPVRYSGLVLTPEPPHSAPLPSAQVQHLVSESALEVQKVEDYVEGFHSSLGQVSTLTLSLTLLPEASSLTNPDIMSIRMYYFGSSMYLDLPLQKTITAGQLVPKALSSYLRSTFSEERPLPAGPIAEAYELWMVDDDTNFPDFDFLVEKDRVVRELAVDALAICEVPGYAAVATDLSEHSWRRVSQCTSGIPLKIHFQENFTVLSVSPETKLRDIVHHIEKKFPHAGYLNPEEYAFKTSVEAEDSVQKEECVLDMDLQVKSLGSVELTLHKKLYIDSPTPLNREDSEDHNRFYMTYSEAKAYKSYKVTKYNRRGKAQERVLGIDQFKLYNRPEAVKDRQKPDICMSQLHCAEQDPRNLHCFYIEYLHEGTVKRNYYGTETSATAAEIVAKLAKLRKLS